jgi:hypothetical protein
VEQPRMKVFTQTRQEPKKKKEEEEEDELLNF